MATTTYRSITTLELGANQYTVANAALENLSRGISGAASVSVTSANVTLTDSDENDQAKNLILLLTGLSTGARQVIVPTLSRAYLVANNTTGGFTHTVKTAAGTGIAIAPGTVQLVWCDGTNVVDIDAPALLADDSVTFAKMQNIATDRLLGRDTASSGDPEELTVSGGLEFTGSGGIQRSALSGDVTASAGSNVTALAASSESVAGKIELATQAETNTGSDDNRAVTPLKLAAATTVVHALTYSAGADANTTMAVNTVYVVDMSAWATADRTYTLPAVAAVGAVIGIMIAAGDATHELLITAGSGDTLNGVAGGTEWSRLMITGEVVMLRCVTANAAWLVEHDGRIPQKAVLRLSTTADGETANTYTRPTQAATPGAWTATADNASISSTSGDSITPRRAGLFYVQAGSSVNDGVGDQQGHGIGIFKNAGADPDVFANEKASGTTFVDTAIMALLPLSANDALVFQYVSTEGGKGVFAGATVYSTFFSLVEVLP